MVQPAMPPFRPTPPPSLRNGLKWRDGRPRWEPSPASRKLGVAGKDLRNPDRSWMDRGAAIGAADARALWASMLRDAYRPGAIGEEARADLRSALEALPKPADTAGAHARELVADIIALGRKLIADLDGAAGIDLSFAPRSVKAMVDGYFADPKVKISASSREAYGTQSRRLVARFGERQLATVTRKVLSDWYEDELLPTLSVSNANQAIGATAAFLTWAVNNEWIAASPAVKLGLRMAPGRRVFWTLADEDGFTAFADANGYADVADGIVTTLWTGARIGDVCTADLADLSAPTWRYVPEKTKRLEQEAMPGVMPQVRKRVERRRAQLVTALEAGGQPFLLNPNTGRRHNANSFGHRFREARGKFVASGEAPDGFIHKRTQDTRDTCITRLFLAGVPIDRMWTWTGHSQDGIEDILRAHYIVLREEGATAMLDQLAAWFDKHQVKL